MDFHIIPECYVDTNLSETLAPPTGKGYNHQKGCGTVASVMTSKLSDDFALGIIDKDRQELDYAKQFATIAAKGNLELMKHPNRNHFFIRIVGGMEQFLLQSAATVKISPEDFDLPIGIAEFRVISKTETSKKDHRFRSFFKAIYKAGHQDFHRLQKWINYLKSHPYDADTQVLEAM